MRRLLLALGSLCLLSTASSAGWTSGDGTSPVSPPAVSLASDPTITFDELPLGTALNGASVKGVTFGFTLNGAPTNNPLDAAFSTLTGPGGIAPFIIPPDAEGDAAGTVTLTFAQAVSSVSFGLARSATGTSVATVQLFSGATSLGSFPVNASITLGRLFPEGLFTSTASNVTSAMITFPSPSVAHRFALDNLSFTAAVPEPGGLTLLGAGLAGTVILAWLGRNRAGVRPARGSDRLRLPGTGV